MNEENETVDELIEGWKASRECYPKKDHLWVNEIIDRLIEDRERIKEAVRLASRDAEIILEKALTSQAKSFMSRPQWSLHKEIQELRKEVLAAKDETIEILKRYGQ